MIASDTCPACENAKKVLGVENGKLKLDNEGSMLYVIYPAGRPEYLKKFEFKTTPSFAFFTVEDNNFNNIFEGVEETHIKTYRGFLGLKGIKEILEQIDLSIPLETKVV